MKRFYVSVLDGPRHNLLAGPFDTHAEALAEVERVRAVALELDAKAHFYAFGTCSVGDYSEPGFLNKHGFI